MIRVLFVCSGNKLLSGSIIENQRESLLKTGDLSIDYYYIKGKGLIGYLKNIIPLKKVITEHKYDLVHSHYLFSALIASFAGCKPLVVSLMGSDIFKYRIYKPLIWIFNFFFTWDSLIVKSKRMYNTLGIKHAIILPNGVDFEKFSELDRPQSLNNLSWDKLKFHILFAADPDRVEKNFNLALRSVQLLGDNYELHYLENVPNSSMPVWYNASDVILLTSTYEGSPNVIKEAMACCRPIVCTDVGDVREIINGTGGCFVCNDDPIEISESIKKAISYNNGTSGRGTIKNLDSHVIAVKLLDVYKGCLNRNTFNLKDKDGKEQRI